MNATPRPFAIEVIGDDYCVVNTSPYVQHGEVSPEALIVARCESQDDAALIVHAVNLLNSGVLDEAKAVLEKYTHYGQLQSFESREQFRTEAGAVLAKLEGKV